MYKIGDKVVIRSDDCMPYGRLGEIVTITYINPYNTSELRCHTTYKDTNWAFQTDDVISLEIYNSPLYKTMMEEESESWNSSIVTKLH